VSKDLIKDYPTEIYNGKFWKLRESWFKFKRAIRVLFNTSTHHIKLVPIQHLTIEKNKYRQKGDSPQITLLSSRKELPCNWSLVSYLAEAEQGVLTPKLYIDSGNGFTEEEAIYLTTQINNEYMIRLPQRVNGLRLDPISTSESFTLSNFKIREISKLQATWILMEKRIKPIISDPKRVLEIFQKGISLIASGRVSELKNNLLSYEKRASGYQQWIYLYDILTKEDRNAIDQRLIHLTYKPLISIVMPVYNPSEKWLRLAIDSVINQIYPHWELCIADDASPGAHVREVLQEYQKKDARIKVTFRDKNGHISAASNSAIELVEGEFIALMDHDDELAEHALYMIAEELNNYPDADLIYSDEDKIDEQGQRKDPYFKPDWDPDLFCSQNLINHLGVYRTSLLREVGGFQLGYEGSQDHDLALRIVERIDDDRIRHIPHILYHWRTIVGSTASLVEKKDYACEAARGAIESHFERRKISVKVTVASDNCKGFHRVIYPLPAELPLVSLIIPTKDHYELLKNCVDSILNKTDYPNIELIIVDNQSQDSSTLAYLEKLKMEYKIRVIKYDTAFNYSAINNTAVNHASGDIIGLINNDIEVISPGWLREMVSHTVRPEVGVVGAKLYYADDTIQHAGVILGMGGEAGHASKYLSRDAIGYRGQAVLLKNFSAVTGACLLMRRNVFKEVGGLDEKNLPIAFNDIDLCIRVRERGYRVLLTPYAELYHLEARSRGSDDTPKRRLGFAREVDFMHSRWGDILSNDPFYNPNLTLNHILESEDFSLAFPPRSSKPWK
jgi:O-antigen biosynthesis protein